MKGWLRLGILFLIIASGIVVVNASAKSTSACGTTVQSGLTVDISRCVSTTDTIGWWFDPSYKNKASPDMATPFTQIDPHTFNTTGLWSGNYYVLNSNGIGTKKVLTIVE